MQIEVKQYHIDHGKRKHCNDCPVALAINNKMAEIFPNSNIQTLVGDWTVSIIINSKLSFDRELPYTAAKFIADFDRGMLMKPFIFEIGDITNVSSNKTTS